MKAVSEFPDFLNPVFVKELRQGVRARSFVIPFVVVQVAMLLALGFDGFGAPEADPTAGRSRMAFPFDVFSTLPNQAAFWTFLFPLMTLAIPYRGLQAVNSEKDERNGELVLLTRLTRWNLIWGKWMALNALGLVTIISCLPYLLARYFLGGMNVPLTIFFVGLIVLANFTANAFAIGISGYSVGKRILLVFFGLITMWIGMAIGSVGIGLAIYHVRGAPEFDFITAMLMLAGLTAVSLFYPLCWLQVGRAKLRLFEDPLAGSASATMLTLFFCSPVLLGAFSVITMGYGVIPTFLFMTLVVAFVDPAPKKSKKVPYAGAYSH